MQACSVCQVALHNLMRLAHTWLLCCCLPDVWPISVWLDVWPTSVFKQLSELRWDTALAEPIPSSRAMLELLRHDGAGTVVTER